MKLFQNPPPAPAAAAKPVAAKLSAAKPVAMKEESMQIAMNFDAVVKGVVTDYRGEGFFFPNLLQY